MLYDPKWEKTETKVDPLTLPALIAWLENQSPAETYCYFKNGQCLLAQYFQHTGVAKSVGGESYHPLIGGERQPMPPHFNSIAYHHPHTFGAALERARALL